jgi:hypothetical protein
MFYFGQRFWDIAPDLQSRARGYVTSSAGLATDAARERRARPRWKSGIQTDAGAVKRAEPRGDYARSPSAGLATDAARERRARPLTEYKPLRMQERSSAPNRAENYQKPRFYTVCVFFSDYLCKKTEKNVTKFFKNQKTAKPA